VAPTINEDDAQDAQKLTPHESNLQNIERLSEQASAYMLSTISAEYVIHIRTRRAGEVFRSFILRVWAAAPYSGLIRGP
jgi:hypothetical protein